VREKMGRSVVLKNLQRGTANSTARTTSSTAMTVGCAKDRPLEGGLEERQGAHAERVSPRLQGPGALAPWPNGGKHAAAGACVGVR